jgi:acetyltransferase-like isoleucine patch superfamily enzyme
VTGSLVPAPRLQRAVARARKRANRALNLRRIYRSARRVDAVVYLDITPSAVISLRAAVEFTPGSSNSFRIGHNSSLAPGVCILLDGGDCTLGPNVRFDTSVVAQVSGVLRCAGQNVIGARSHLDARRSIVIDAHTRIEEHVTISDAPPDGVDAGGNDGLRIGRNSWVRIKASVLGPVSIGSNCVVEPGAVLTEDLPAGGRAEGVPARVRHDLESNAGTARFLYPEERPTPAGG